MKAVKSNYLYEKFPHGWLFAKIVTSVSFLMSYKNMCENFCKEYLFFLLSQAKYSKLHFNAAGLWD